MDLLSDILQTATLRDLADILAVAVVFYATFRIFERTRTLHLLALLLAILGILLISRRLGLTTLNHLIDQIWAFFLIGLIILFQPDIRRTLTQLPTSRFFGKGRRTNPVLIHEIVVAARLLARRRSGALLVLERNDKLDPYLEGGTRIDARLSTDLLVALFMKRGPLHDGAVIIRGDRVVAAGCILPLSQRPDLSHKLGTRHRAALGLAEETDAIVVVVSEERKTVSVAIAGKMTPAVQPETLEEMLTLYAVG